MHLKPLWTGKFDRLNVEVYESKDRMGRAAAARAAAEIERTTRDFQKLNLLVSTGASQFEFIDALSEMPQLSWDLVDVFHLDEYIGISASHPSSFRHWIRTRIEERWRPKSVQYIEGDAQDPEAECRRYAALIASNPIDLGFIGIGENGHLAFNDPPVADFRDEKAVKVVELDHACRTQQVNEGWFETLDDVPRHAITLTIPTIMKSRTIISVVPDQRKADAVFHALTGPIEETWPASILREHPNATLYLDAESASLIMNGR